MAWLGTEARSHLSMSESMEAKLWATLSCSSHQSFLATEEAVQCPREAPLPQLSLGRATRDGNATRPPFQAWGRDRDGRSRNSHLGLGRVRTS